MKNSELIQKLRALKESAVTNKRSYDRMQSIAGILNEADDRMARYEEAKQDPKSLVGYEFSDNEQGMTRSGRGTVIATYKVISYLGEKGGKHYYGCQKTEGGKAVEYARPKTYSLEDILAIY